MNNNTVGIDPSVVDDSGNTGRVLPVVLSDKNTLYQSYMPFIENGALFVASNKQYMLGDEVFLLIKLMDESKKYPISGKVIWITPPCAQGGRNPGIGVQFVGKDASNIKNKIDTYLAGSSGSDRCTDTL